MAKILYISPEHISGNLTLFQLGHRRRGHECRFVTFFPSSSGFPEDICLHLPLMPDSGLVKFWKKRIYRTTPEMLGIEDRAGFPPVWRPATAAEALFFLLRDRWLAPRIHAAVRRYGLDRFDLYHLDQGLDFFRDGRFILRMKSRGAYVTCFYHGTDLRNRGVIPAIDAVSDLNLTSELDLLEKHPAIRYLHLPFDVQRFQIRTVENHPLVIGHACRGREARHFKGTERIVQVVRELERTYAVRLDLVEGLPHDECLRRKANWDIAVDQIADVGGWGYGVNSLETLSLGIPTCTRMNDRCAAFFADHPFVNVDGENLKSELIKLVANPDYRRRKGLEGREWVMKRHSLESVMDELYAHYAAAGIHLDVK
jgi:glycosyltransferase involved in cell wall biosynthesis